MYHLLVILILYLLVPLSYFGVLTLYLVLLDFLVKIFVVLFFLVDYFLEIFVLYLLVPLSYFGVLTLYLVLLDFLDMIFVYLFFLVDYFLDVEFHQTLLQLLLQ